MAPAQRKKSEKMVNTLKLGLLRNLVLAFKIRSLKCLACCGGRWQQHGRVGAWRCGICGEYRAKHRGTWGMLRAAGSAPSLCTRWTPARMPIPTSSPRRQPATSTRWKLNTVHILQLHSEVPQLLADLEFHMNLSYRGREKEFEEQVWGKCLGQDLTASFCISLRSARPQDHYFDVCTFCWVEALPTPRLPDEMPHEIHSLQAHSPLQVGNCGLRSTATDKNPRLQL